MLVVTPLTVAGAAYFLDGPRPGLWAGDAAALGLAGPVGARPLRRVLAGRHPATGEPLGNRRPAHRRAGWDLTFAAPKSLSLVAAMAGDDDARAITSAHRQAVGDALGWLTARGARASRSGRVEVAEGLVLARYDHDVSDSGDPHLHSHVLLANLALAAGIWSALASSPLWPAMRPLGGIYRSALRARSDAAGLAFAWRPNHPGSAGGEGLIDLAGVPAAAVTAASRRHRQVASALGTWESPEVAGRATRRAVRAVSRTSSGDTGADAAPAGGWRQAVESAGFGPRQAAAVLAAARATADHPAPHSHPAPHGHNGTAPAGTPDEPPGRDAAVTAWLRARSTTFTGLDVARAVVATHQGGLLPADLDAWVRRFCATPDPWTGRWTTAAAGHDVARLVTAAGRPRTGGHGAPDDAVTAAAAAHRLDREESAQLRGLLAGGTCVAALAGVPGSSRLVSQAAVLAAARESWEASGLTVAVLAPAAAVRRWDALAGLRPAPPGEAPAVLVVDRADRRPSPELAALFERAARHGTTLVLVGGGTLAARHHPASTALLELAGRAPAAGRFSPADGLRWQAAAVDVTGPGGLGCVVGIGPRDAIGALADRWALAPPGGRPQLVGLGPAEVEALNAAARARRVALGELAGPALDAGGRAYQAGDTVMALRRMAVPSGTYGTVTAVDVGKGRVTVEWPGGDATVDRHDARRLGHGYATGPARVPAAVREILLLGAPTTVRHLRGRITGVGLVAPSARRPPARQLDTLAAMLAHPVGSPGPRRVTERATYPLPVLEESRRQLAARLMALGPPDPEAAALLATEARQWAPPGATADPTVPALRPGPPERDIRAWVAAHASDLAEWRLLGDAAARRRDAMARADLLDGHHDPSTPAPLALEPGDPFRHGPPPHPAQPEACSAVVRRDPGIGLGLA